MPLMKAVQVSTPGGPFEMVERPIPEPGRGHVRVKVEACGICHSDVLVKEGLWPGLQYPRVPGHEIAGRVDAVGADVTTWKPGQRVGVGWHGGHCFVCDPCRRGDFILCRFGKVTSTLKRDDLKVLSHSLDHFSLELIPASRLQNLKMHT